MRVEFKRSQTSIDLIRKALADMGVSQKSSAATAAAPAGRGPSQHAAEHDHGSDHVHGPDHGSADHKHGEDGDPSHEHGGIFGERTELIFALLRSEEHTSELQSLMRISYAVFCLKQKKKLT